ncbi:unnamed protein product, partial [Ectocarpus sp. 12 AP-2014]
SGVVEAGFDDGHVPLVDVGVCHALDDFRGEFTLKHPLRNELRVCEDDDLHTGANSRQCVQFVLAQNTPTVGPRVCFSVQLACFFHLEPSPTRNQQGCDQSHDGFTHARW